MKVLFLVPYPHEGASNRYRVEQYLPFLGELGIRFLVRPFWCRAGFDVLYKNGYFCKKLYYFILGTFFRLFDILRVFRYDAVFIHREAYPIFGAFFEKAVSLLRVPLIFDFDDAIFLPAKSAPNNFIERFKRPRKISEIIAMSSYVIAGNGYLADYALKFNKNVGIIPTAIDTDAYPPKTAYDTDEVVIGWIGSATTLDFLNGLEGVFRKLLQRFKNIKIKVIGGSFHINGLTNVISQPWSLATEIESLKAFDIGIMPMPDNDWTRGKCGFKAILYMSIAIPCVSSPVGVNKEVIQDGSNGFLASSDEEWLDKLSLLIQSPQLRKKIGSLGRKTVEEKYSVKANAPNFLEVIKKVYNSNGP